MTSFPLILDNVTFDGKPCRNIDVEIAGKTDGIAINCVKDCEYNIQFPPGYEGPSCLTLKITCLDKHICKEAQCSFYKTVCLCDDKSDCPNCNECIDGICVEQCPEEQCFNNQCAQCSDDSICPCDQICRNGNCVCPTGRIANGDCCVDCDENNPCPDCYDCVGGTCLPKCPDSHCDPLTETCVECTLDGHCEGANQICIDGTCQCGPGFTQNLCSDTDDCVPIPINACNSTQPCGICESCQNIDQCTGYGTCVPQGCRDGFICLNGDCVEECDCVEGGCSKGTAVCAQLNDIQCYCKDCSTFSCTEEGASACGGANSRECTCNEQGQCVPDPCFGIVCPFGQVCENGICVSDGGTCDTEVTLEKIEDGINCDLRASWGNTCCPCPALEAVIQTTANSGNFNFAVQFQKDGSNLSDSNQNNKVVGDNKEIPTSGQICARVSYKQERVIPLGNGLTRTQIVEIPITQYDGDSFNGSSDLLNINNVPVTLGNVPGGVNVEARVDIILKPTQNTNSNCTWGGENGTALHSYFITDTNQLSAEQTGRVYSSDCGNAIVQFADSQGDFIRIYTDLNELVLKGPLGEGLKDPNLQKTVLGDQYGRLKSCETYTVTVCCCAEGTATEEVKFCKTVDDFTAVSLNKCSTRVEYNVPATCDINSNSDFRITTSGEYTWTRKGSVLPTSNIIESDDPIEWVQLEMLCDDGRVACTNRIDLDALEPELTPTYSCPDTVTFPNVSPDGQCAVERIETTQGVLNGGGILTIDPSVAFVRYTVHWADRCKPFESSIQTPCTCANDPCAESNYECGSRVDICGNVRQCGNCPPNRTEAGDCFGGVQQITNITYNCQSGRCIENRTVETITGICPPPAGLTIDCGIGVSYCPGQSVQVPLLISGGTPTYTYVWTRNGQQIFTGTSGGSVNISAGASGVLNTPGAYMVTVRDVTGAQQTCTLVVQERTPSECSQQGCEASTLIGEPCSENGCNGIQYRDPNSNQICIPCNAPSQDVCGTCGGNETDPNNCNTQCNDTCGSLGFTCGTHTICGNQTDCGSCGQNFTNCADGTVRTCQNMCNNGVCSDCTPPACNNCQPITCASINATCGTHDDGCGGIILCGTCGNTSNPACPDKTCTNSCTQTSIGWSCSNCTPDDCNVATVSGCTDPAACNYVNNANSDDGSCDYCSCATSQNCDTNCTTGATRLIGSDGRECQGCSGGTQAGPDCTFTGCAPGGYSDACGNQCPPNTTNCPVDCVGAWSACSATQCNSTSSQTYTISVQASNGGAQCPFVQGATRSCSGPTCQDDPACCAATCNGNAYDDTVFGCCNNTLLYNLQSQQCCAAQNTVVGINESCTQDNCAGTNCTNCTACDPNGPVGNCNMNNCSGDTSCCNNQCLPRCEDGNFPTTANNCDCPDVGVLAYALCSNGGCSNVPVCSGVDCFTGTGSTQLLANQAALDSCEFNCNSNPVTTYNCVNNMCQPQNGPNGTFATLPACRDSGCETVINPCNGITCGDCETCNQTTGVCESSCSASELCCNGSCEGAFVNCDGAVINGVCECCLENYTPQGVGCALSCGTPAGDCVSTNPCDALPPCSSTLTTNCCCNNVEINLDCSDPMYTGAFNTSTCDCDMLSEPCAEPNQPCGNGCCPGLTCNALGICSVTGCAELNQPCGNGCCPGLTCNALGTCSLRG